MASWRRLAGAIILLPVRVYRYAISPWLPPSCRFSPTCSAYAEEAVRLHGVLRGSSLAVRRICRCHPFAQGGYDPVPEPVRPGVRDSDPD